jgi:hypothetical protein
MDPMSGCADRRLDKDIQPPGSFKGQEPSCCCSYDPFEDVSPESRILDLSFALKKLSVMKCQMRKWQLERLRLESQTRSLKIALQVNGKRASAGLGTPRLWVIRVPSRDPASLFYYYDEEVRFNKELERLAEMPLKIHAR